LQLGTDQYCTLKVGESSGRDRLRAVRVAPPDLAAYASLTEAPSVTGAIGGAA